MQNNLNQSDALKAAVKEKYTQAAQSKNGCGCACNSDDSVTLRNEIKDYQKLEGYQAEADLGLGCGLPTEYARLKTGDTVLDLGSGAGNDCFVARAVVGESGQVIGVDMTEAMVTQAQVNAQKLGFENVKFYLGEIEDLPIDSDSIDVVVSNCVMNLVPDKLKAFQETYRVLKAGAHFSISDIVLEGDLPEVLQKDMEMYVGCVSGALQKEEYLKTIQTVGFQNIQIQKESKITIPEHILSKYMSEEQIKAFQASDSGIYSVTVYAEK